MLPTLGALTLALIATQTQDALARRRLWVISALLAAVAGIVHTRSIVVILAAAAATIGSRQVSKLPTTLRRISAGAFLFAIAAVVLYVMSLPALLPALEPYYGSGLGPTVVASILCIFAFKFRPQVALSICLFAALLLAGLILPVPLPEAGTLLDRPFVELWIFVPLSLLGAVGLAGLIPHLGVRATTAAIVIATAALGAHALAAYDTRASSCCTIVTADDMIALDWVGTNLKAEDIVGIATEPLQLGPAPYPTLDAPVDAGAWIGPLTGIGVVSLPHDLDLGERAVVQDLCQRGVYYLYLGGSGRGFGAAAISRQPARFTPRVQLPGASIIEIVDCDG
jgi:hypothetical protein